jgi:hypothetical protein
VKLLLAGNYPALPDEKSPRSVSEPLPDQIDADKNQNNGKNSEKISNTIVRQITLSPLWFHKQISHV